MKVLHIITSLNCGGAEKLLLDTCKEQVLDGNKVEVIYLKTEGVLRDEFEKVGVKVEKYDMEKNNILWCLLKIILSIKDKRYDVVHTHLTHAQLMGIFSAKIVGVKKIVSTIHATDRWRLKNDFAHRCIKKIDSYLSSMNNVNVIAISNSVKQFVLSNQLGFKGDNFRVIYNAINLEDIDIKSRENFDWNNFTLNKEDFKIVNIGRLDIPKGQVILLKALDRLINDENIRNIKCLIIGDGNCYDELSTFIKDKGLNNNVFLVGLQKNPYKYLKVADLFVMPSIHEGFGIAVLEAYACGIPVLATNADGLMEIVENNFTGVTIDKGNFNAMANEIKKFYKKEYNTTYFINNAKNFVKEFNIKNYVKKLENIYKC